MNDNDTVCYCKGVTVKDIKDSIANGAKSFEEIQEVTKAGTGCGRCVSSIKDLVKELL